jgi:hypothetical protein
LVKSPAHVSGSRNKWKYQKFVFFSLRQNEEGEGDVQWMLLNPVWASPDSSWAPTLASLTGLIKSSNSASTGLNQQPYGYQPNATTTKPCGWWNLLSECVYKCSGILNYQGNSKIQKFKKLHRSGIEPGTSSLSVSPVISTTRPPWHIICCSNLKI